MSLELLKKRLAVRGGSAEGRMAQEKLETLKKALLYSYQAETVVKDGEEYRALLNNNKLKMDYDDKIISIPFETGFKVGDIFYWERIGENWIVYLRQYSEDAYFRGYVRKAQHKIKWLNEYGKELETYAAVRGPVETKIKGEVKSGILYDLPNYTLSIIVPNNEDTSALKRYSKVTLEGKVWEIAVADAISEPGVIDLQLIESYKNKDEDNDYVGGLIKPEVKVVTNLDGITSLDINTPIEITCDVYVNGKIDEEIAKEAKMTVKEGTAILVGNVLTLIDTDSSIIAIDIDKTGTHLEFNINSVVEKLSKESTLEIKGDEVVKSYGTTTYTAERFVNGKSEEVSGEWIVKEDRNLFAISNRTKNSITFKWTGMVGTVSLEYRENNDGSIKNIKVESLL